MFDETVRSILSKILNVNLAQESAWMQQSEQEEWESDEQFS